MKAIGFFEIYVTGFNEDAPLKPGDVDIREIKELLEAVEDLIYPLSKDRPSINYSFEEGAVRHIFYVGAQALIGLKANLEGVVEQHSIDFLELKSALALERIQNTSYKKNHAFELKTTIQNKAFSLYINPSTTYKRIKEMWVDSEMYFYGEITNIGGKNKTNLHLMTEEYGTVIIETPKTFVMNEGAPLIYRKFGFRVAAKQHSTTGELDRSSFKFLELVAYQPQYNEAYLNKKIKKSSPKWKDIQPELWLNELRGDYEV